MNHTPGPWRWEVNHKYKQVSLCGERNFDLEVMDFRRWGMQGAQPMFRDDDQILHGVDVFSAAVPGREHHAEWFQTLDHPDARLIAAAPDLLGALKLTPLDLHVADERGPCLCSQCKFRRAAAAAIAKAEGGAI